MLLLAPAIFFGVTHVLASNISPDTPTVQCADGLGISLILSVPFAWEDEFVDKMFACTMLVIQCKSLRGNTDKELHRYPYCIQRQVSLQFGDNTNAKLLRNAHSFREKHNQPAVPLKYESLTPEDDCPAVPFHVYNFVTGIGHSPGPKPCRTQWTDIEIDLSGRVNWESKMAQNGKATTETNAGKDTSQGTPPHATSVTSTPDTSTKVTSTSGCPTQSTGNENRLPETVGKEGGSFLNEMMLPILCAVLLVLWLATLGCLVSRLELLL